jgi:hypothetical protein
LTLRSGIRTESTSTSNRLSVAADGRVVLRLRHTVREGDMRGAVGPRGDLLACLRCGGRLRLVAFLEAGAVTFEPVRVR